MVAGADYPWLDRRRSVSFRGLRFEVLVDEQIGGHRVHVHTYLDVDEPYTEELGLTPDAFSLTAVIAGDDYDKRLKKLVGALKLRGRGKLQLWYGDPVYVVARRWRIIQRSDGAGAARVRIDFVDAGRSRNPQGTPAGASRIAARLDGAIGAFSDAYGTVASNVATVTSLAEAMQDRLGEFTTRIEDAMDTVDGAAGLGEDMATAITQFTDDLATLATDVVAMPDRMSSLFQELHDMPSTIRGQYQEFLDLSGWGYSIDPIPTDSAFGALEAANQTALADLVMRFSLLRASESAVEITFESATDAAAVRDELGSAFDVAILIAGDSGEDTVYDWLRDLKSVAVGDLDARVARLPARVEVSLAHSIPAVVLSNRLYGDASRTDEIVARNRVRHPGFLPTTRPLEVISVESNGNG